MDLSYLLFLQEFRHSINDAWTPFLEQVSHLAVSYLIFIPIFIYWCISKHNGLFILASLFVGKALNTLVKLSVCAYRPWIRDPRIIPAGHAIDGATGYSFPSGHTISGTTMYGGLAVVCWQKRAMQVLSFLCVVALLLTGFSRNYLGVHTPQDVAVGILLSVFTLYLVYKGLAYIEKHPAQENRLLLGGVCVSVLALLFITFKPYPMDYADGKLLVDPQRMMIDGYYDLGALLSLFVSRFIEKRWIRFTQTGLTVKGILIGIAGLGIAYGFKQVLEPCIELLGVHWGVFVYAFLWVFFIIALYPLAIKVLGGPNFKK